MTPSARYRGGSPASVGSAAGLRSGSPPDLVMDLSRAPSPCRKATSEKRRLISAANPARRWPRVSSDNRTVLGQLALCSGCTREWAGPDPWRVPAVVAGDPRGSPGLMLRIGRPTAQRPYLPQTTAGLKPSHQGRSSERSKPDFSSRVPAAGAQLDVVLQPAAISMHRFSPESGGSPSSGQVRGECRGCAAQRHKGVQPEQRS